MNTFEKYHIRAKKSLWQNFLVDTNILSKIVASSHIDWKNIVEVWPWYWALTDYIVDWKPSSLLLIELDRDMIDILSDRIENWELYLNASDINIVNLDVLQYEREDDSTYSVIANIPYYITSPILHHFLYAVSHSPEEMVIMMQKDVADKILASQKIKKPKSSVLSLFLSKKTNVESIVDVPRTAFSPAPKVDSSVLKFIGHTLYNDVDDEVFLSTIKKWFCEPRKLVIKNLVKSGFDKKKVEDIFEKLSISTLSRPENLDINNWCDFVRENK